MTTLFYLEGMPVLVVVLMVEQQRRRVWACLDLAAAFDVNGDAFTSGKNVVSSLYAIMAPTQRQQTFS